MDYHCPCKGCQNRSITCHGECDKYDKWREDLDRLNERNRPNKDAWGYIADSIKKNSKQTNRLRRKITHAQ